MKSKGGLAAALIVLAMAVAATPASAASTRAEYVAQVEPICQAASGPAAAANARLGRKEKDLIRASKHGSAKAFIASIHAVARALVTYAGIDDALTAQLETVPAAPPDAAAVASWLQGRRDTTQLVRGSAQALNRFKIRRSFKLIDQANAAYARGVAAVADFGFNYCLTA